MHGQKNIKLHISSIITPETAHSSDSSIPEYRG
jgi:hypothetical protein